MIKIALMGRVDRFAPAFEHVKKNLEPKAEIVGFCPSGDASEPVMVCEELGEHLYPKVTFYGDFETMIEDCTPDVLVLSSPCGQREEEAKYALERGISVCSEGPITQDSEQLEILYTLAQEHSALCWTMQTRRFDDAVYAVKRLASEKAIGCVRSISVSISHQAQCQVHDCHEAGHEVHVISHMALDALDLARYLSEEPIQRVAAMSCAACEDSSEGHGHHHAAAAMIQLQMDHGVLADVRVDDMMPASSVDCDMAIRIMGSEGLVELHNGRVHIMNKKYTEKTEIEDLKVSPVGLFTAFLFAYDELKHPETAFFRVIPEEIRKTLDAGLSNRSCERVNRLALLAEEAAQTGQTLEIAELFDDERAEIAARLEAERKRREEELARDPRQQVLARVRARRAGQI
ncbi:MAG: Gfo/Idh/MocA family oxidoreductase [Eubacteriales bacterium]|nr:Gfo/Idh/MocA family oxidoreductase [Eubacteriales bacterium]